jgi:2-dehydropantoate 2-reductase
MLEKPVIVVVGAGALGSYYGGRLARAGYEVHFLLRSEYEAVKERGMMVKSCHGDFFLGPEVVRVHRDASTMPRADLVIVSIKTTANSALPGMIGPVMKAGTILLTLQNGLGNEDFLAAHFGREHVIGGVAFVCINRTGPGVIEHTAHGNIKIGEMEASGSVSERVGRISEMFNGSGVKCEAVGDLKRARGDKLMCNIPFTGLSRPLQQTTD